MRPYFKRTVQFKTIYTMNDDVSIVLDCSYCDELNDAMKGMTVDEQESFISNHKDVFFQDCPIESVYFKTREEAVYYLKKYGCLLFDDFKNEYLDIVESDEVDDLFFIGHKAAVEITYPMIVVMDYEIEELRRENERLGHRCAKLESAAHGTCKITATATSNLMYPDYMTKWYELSCGHSMTLMGQEVPKWCAVCGKVVNR